MTILGQNKPDIIDLVQSGVKGMKWGVRKNSYTNAEIQAARHRQAVRILEARNLARQARMQNGKPKSTTERKILKKVADWETSEDRVIATRISRGEKILHVVLLGPLSAVTLSANAIKVRNTKNEVDKQRFI